LSSCHSPFRSSERFVLPLIVFGSASTNFIYSKINTIVTVFFSLDGFLMTFLNNNASALREIDSF